MHGRNVRTGVCIFAENMDRMVCFYRDILGFETDWDGGAFAEFFTAGGRLSFFMYSKEEFVKAINEDYRPADGLNQTFEIGMWLPTYEDIDEEYERLSKLDVKFPAGGPSTCPCGIRNCYVSGPGGNRLEIGSDRLG